MPDTIKIPSTVKMDMVMNNTCGLPDDLTVYMKLTKHEPFAIDVPCVNGIGSCEYDGCAMIADNPQASRLTTTSSARKFWK